MVRLVRFSKVVMAESIIMLTDEFPRLRNLRAVKDAIRAKASELTKENVRSSDLSFRGGLTIACQAVKRLQETTAA